MARAKKTFCVVAYDIKEDRKRARVSKILEKYGIRVNFSVFECMFTDIKLLQVQEKIKKYWINAPIQSYTIRFASIVIQKSYINRHIAKRPAL